MKKNTSNEPVYITIFSELRDQIVNGSLPPGSILPSENELCLKYSTTRETARKGLKQLEQEGLIYSKPRRGYFVNYPQHDEFSLAFPKNLNQSDSRFKDIKIILPEKEIRDALQVPENHKVIALFRANYTDNTLYGIEIKYIPYDKGHPSVEKEIDFAVFPEAASAKSTSFSYYTQISVKAVTAPDDILPLLDGRRDEPLLLISRTFITQSGVRIGYSKEYLRAPYGELHGISGYVQNK